jgi:hypothetical protein
MLWDGETEINARPATQVEHERWREAFDATVDDDADDFSIYLVPVKSVEEADGEAAVA